MLELHKLAVGYVYLYIYINLRAKCKVQAKKEMQTWTQMQILIGYICITEKFSATETDNRWRQSVLQPPFSACLAQGLGTQDHMGYSQREHQHDCLNQQAPKPLSKSNRQAGNTGKKKKY